jgi:hypothetical protein
MVSNGGIEMLLRSGLRIQNPLQELRDLAHRWYPLYDGVVVERDNALRPIEIALSVMLNSQISGNTAALIWEHRGEIELQLAQIPANLDLIETPDGGRIPGIDAIVMAFERMCALKRVKLGIASKILHKKRPALIPIIDSRVYSYYHARVIHRWRRGISWGDQVATLVGLFHRDMLSVESELRDLSNSMYEPIIGA